MSLRFDGIMENVKNIPKDILDPALLLRVVKCFSCLTREVGRKFRVTTAHLDELAAQFRQAEEARVP